jgi:hypothetical protein
MDILVWISLGIVFTGICKWLTNGFDLDNEFIAFYCVLMWPVPFLMILVFIVKQIIASFDFKKWLPWEIIVRCLTYLEKKGEKK